VRVGEFKHVEPDRRHVQDGGNQVVREGGVPNHPIGYLDLLHDGQAEALGDAALDLALDRLRVYRLADILRGRDFHHLDQAELSVHVDDRAVGSKRVLHMGLALAGAGIQRVSGPVPPGHRRLGRLAEQLGQAGSGAGEALVGPAFQLLSHRLAGGPHRAAGHIGLPGG